MKHTLVAVFDQRSDAQDALDELLASGFARQEARLSEGDPADPAAASATPAHEGIGSTLKQFFSDLFGTDRSEHARMYAEAVHRGHYVLTLNVDTQSEVERAADIVERYGPVDIDEQAQQWRGGMPGADSARQHMSGMSQQAARGGGLDAQAVSRQDAQQRADSMPDPDPDPDPDRGSVRIYSRADTTALHETAGLRQEQLAPDDDAYYRGHWTSTFASLGGSYDEYAPAYRYGSDMARSELYRGRPWHDVENNLHIDWEARNPGSAWERMKAAVRHGWERMTS